MGGVTQLRGRTAGGDGRCVVRRYKWTCGGGRAQVLLPIPRPLITHFQGGADRYGSDGYRDLANGAVTQRLLKLYVRRFRTAAGTAWSRHDLIMRMVTFVQSLEYREIRDGIASPVEVLAEGAAVCSGRSALLGALLVAINHPVVVLRFHGGGTGHAAVGIGDTGRFSGAHWTHGGRRYYYVETTAKLPVGDKGSERRSKATVVALNAPTSQRASRSKASKMQALRRLQRSVDDAITGAETFLGIMGGR